MCSVCVGVGGGGEGEREGQGTYPPSFSFGSWIALPVPLRSWLGYVLMRESTSFFFKEFVVFNVTWNDVGP